MRMQYKMIKLFIHIYLLSLVEIESVTRRDGSLPSYLLRLLLNKTDYYKSNSEYARVTQSPLIKIHLNKTKLPELFHESIKEPVDEAILRRANDIEQNNIKKHKLLQNIKKSLNELEVLEPIPNQLNLQGVPLVSFIKHNYTDKQWNKRYSHNESLRRDVQHIFNVPAEILEYSNN